MAFILTDLNEQAIPFYLPGEKYTRIFLPEGFREHKLFSAKKLRNPRICTWKEARRQHLIFFDFDELPKTAFRTVKAINFDHLATLLREKFTIFETPEDKEKDRRFVKTQGVVLKTLSGKPKVAVFVDFPMPIKMNRKIYETLALYLLGPELAKEIDHTHAACASAFLSHQMWKDLKELDYSLDSINYSAYGGQTWLDHDMDIALREIEKLPGVREPMDSQHVYKTNKTPDARLKVLVGRDKALKSVLDVISAMPNLIERGFDISQIILARTTGLCQKTISNKLRKLERIGQLKVIDKNTCPGIKAKTFKATGLLLKVLKEGLRKYLAQQKFLPTIIQKGTWNRTMMMNSFKFIHNPKGFMEWISKVPGFVQKDRRKQAKQVLKFIYRLSARKSTESSCLLSASE